MRNLGAWHPLAQHKRAIRESFLRENCIFHQFAKVFSPESFPLYGMYKSRELLHDHGVNLGSSLSEWPKRVAQASSQ